MITLVRGFHIHWWHNLLISVVMIAYSQITQYIFFLCSIVIITIIDMPSCIEAPSITQIDLSTLLNKTIKWSELIPYEPRLTCCRTRARFSCRPTFQSLQVVLNWNMLFSSSTVCGNNVMAIVYCSTRVRSSSRSHLVITIVNGLEVVPWQTLKPDSCCWLETSWDWANRLLNLRLL